MKIALAQIKLFKGNITKNIALHQAAIASAVAQKADAIFFPELSLTGYEPTLTNELKIELTDERLLAFQEISDTKNIIIGIGAPLNFEKGVQIAMLIFQPNRSVLAYAKQFLHEDELPYFISGDKQVFIENGDWKIAPAICYESLQTAHLDHVLAKKATIYLASVAKPQRGIDKANPYFSKMAKEKRITILMVNSVGFCDNFESAGQSAIWNVNGELQGQLSETEVGILIYDVSKNIKGCFNFRETNIA